MVTIKNIDGAVIADIPVETIKQALEYCKRRGHSLKRASLVGQDLSDLDLSHLDLEGSELMFSNLTRTKFRGCYMRAANLAFCDLSDADFSATNLRDAVLGQTTCENTNFSRASIQGAQHEGEFIMVTICSAEVIYNAKSDTVSWWRSTMSLNDFVEEVKSFDLSLDRRLWRNACELFKNAREHFSK